MKSFNMSCADNMKLNSWFRIGKLTNRLNVWWRYILWTCTTYITYTRLPWWWYMVLGETLPLLLSLLRSRESLFRNRNWMWALLVAAADAHICRDISDDRIIRASKKHEVQLEIIDQASINYIPYAVFILTFHCFSIDRLTNTRISSAKNSERWSISTSKTFECG